MKNRFILPLVVLFVVVLASCATKAPEVVEVPVVEAEAVQAPGAQMSIEEILASLGVGNTDSTSLIAAASLALDEEKTEAEANSKGLEFVQKTDEVFLGLPGRNGELISLVQLDEYVVKGVIMTSESGQHDYPTVREQFFEGFGTKNICNEYELGEWFSLYVMLDAMEEETNIYVIKHQDGLDYNSMLPVQVEAIGFRENYPMVWKVEPEMDDYGYMASMYVPEECGPGLYDLLFMAYSEYPYMIQLNITPASN